MSRLRAATSLDQTPSGVRSRPCALGRAVTALPAFGRSAPRQLAVGHRYSVYF
jgi:hypothetical protein